MSSILATLLTGATSTGAGTAVALAAEDRYQGGGHTFEVTGTFVATIDLEATIDGTTWHALATVTAPGLVNVAGVFHSVRADVTAYTSGSVNAAVRYGLLQDLKPDLSTLLARLSAARATALDELRAENLPADVDALTASVATLLARLTSTRAANLDSIPEGASTADVKRLHQQLRKEGKI